MRYIDLSKRELSSTLRKFPHCLILDKADQESLFAEKIAELPWMQFPMAPQNGDFDYQYKFREHDLAREKRDRRSTYWHSVYKQDDPDIFYRIDKKKCLVRLYFPSKDDATLFKMTWG